MSYLMMSKRRYLTVVVLIAATALFLANWDCLKDYSFETVSHNKGQRLGTEECSTDTLSQELIGNGSIQILKNPSSYPSFKQNQASIQIAAWQLEENPSRWLPFSQPKSKTSQIQTYILNSSYLL